MTIRPPGAALRMVLAACALLIAGQVGAQPRTEPPPPPAAEVVTPETEDWLLRLPGRYQFEGVIRHEEVVADPDRDEVDEETGATVMRHTPWRLNIWTQAVQGKGDCIEFGSGPGLQCVINLVWPQVWRGTGKAQLGGVSDLNPAMILAGVAPASGGIRFLLVDQKGLAHPGSSTLRGDTAATSPACVNMPGMQNCKQTVRLTARADGRSPQLVISTSMRFNRSKTDRKPFLERVDPNDPLSPMERPSEWVEEMLDISFSLRRVAQDSADKADK